MLHNIKNKIKSNDYTRAIYDKLQCMYTKAKYSYVKNNFTPKSSKQIFFNKIKKGSKVIYIGTDELQDKSGFIQELEEFCDLKTFTKFNGEYGQYSERRYSDGYGRELNTLRLENILEENAAIGWYPDLILMQSWGRLWNIDKLMFLKQKFKFKVFNICMDDRHSFLMFSLFKKYNRGTKGLIPVLDGALVACKECVTWYNYFNIPAIYFPEATSTKFFYKIRNRIKKYDVGFVGAKYGLRKDYIDYLIKNGINVKAYGNGWESGRLSNQSVNAFFNECKIVLGFGYVLGCKDFMALKLRDFDVPATGSFYLTTYNKDLDELFPEKKSCYFKNKYDLLEKVRFFLKNENKREEIALMSYNNIIKNHTYEQRFKLIFKD